MNEMNERDIVRRMRGLADLTADGERTRAALNGARAAIRRHRMAKWTALSGIAAAVIVAVSLGWLMLSPRAATAADALAAAVDGSNQYKGWIHETGTTSDSKDVFTAHMNSETGDYASVNRAADGAIQVEMYDPAKQERITYNTKEGKVIIDPLTGEFADNWKKSMQNKPWTVAGGIAEMKAMGINVTLKQCRENGLDRFDLILPANIDHSIIDPKDVPSAAALWSDPATRRIVRANVTVQGRTTNAAMTYDDVAIHDVYELGVPRDAVVESHLPAADVKELIARIGKHAEDGLGDFAAVETETAPGQDSLLIYGAKGTSCVADRFALDEKTLPAGWPTPSLETSLAAVSKPQPSSFFAYDGWQAWQGYFRRPGGEVVNEVKAEEIAGRIKYWSLASHLWPVSDLMVGATDWKSRSLSDPSRPGLAGVQIDCMYYTNALDDTRLHQVYWFDVKHGDLIVESTQRYTVVKTNQLDREYHNTLGTFAQTGSGIWYPSTWKTVTDLKAMGVKPTTFEEHLQIWTDKTLSPEWFKPPAVQGQ